jgi:L-asparaginase II
MVRENPALPVDFFRLPAPRSQPVSVGFYRGTAIESIHKVHLCITNSKGVLQEIWGDSRYGFFPRSSIKLVQALLWAESDIRNRYKLSQQEIAISCGSHWAEPQHLAVIEPWLKRLELGEEALECGPHEPYSGKTYRQILRTGGEPSRIHNNCSGKHLGLLTRCAAMGYESKGYSNFAHPIQQDLRELLSELFRLDFGKRAWGIDGCGIPTHHVFLEELGGLAGRLVGGEQLGHRREGFEVVLEAIAAHPALVGGSESYCSQVIEETQGNAIVKVGAEGVYWGILRREGLGFALKVEDGASRAAEVALAALLDYCGYRIVPDSSLVKNWSSEIVGGALLS